MKFKVGDSVTVIEDEKQIVGNVISGGQNHGEEAQYFVDFGYFYNGFGESQLKLV